MKDVLKLIRDAELFHVVGNHRRAIKCLEKAARELRGLAQVLPNWVEVGREVLVDGRFELLDGSRPSGVYAIVKVDRGEPWSVTGEKVVGGVMDRLTIRQGDGLRFWTRCSILEITTRAVRTR